MATSSIIENIRVNNPKVLEEYADFLEASLKEPLKPRNEEQKSAAVNDPERIQKFIEQFLDKKVSSYLQYMKFF